MLRCVALCCAVFCPSLFSSASTSAATMKLLSAAAGGRFLSGVHAEAVRLPFPFPVILTSKEREKGGGREGGMMGERDRETERGEERERETE